MTTSPKSLNLRLLVMLAATWLISGSAWAQNAVYKATDSSFSLKAPSAFQAISPTPANALLALEVPGSGVSILAEGNEAIELETSKFTSEMKKKLSDGGATILGSAEANLQGKPAISFLVGGVKAGKESLFVFNLRADHTYLFVLNYPEGSRQDAAELWRDIAPTISFTPAK